MSKIITDTNARKAQSVATAMQTELAKRRKLLTADELVELKNVKVRLESDFHNGWYFFSIDGALNGKKIQGALWGDCCILIGADSVEKARKIAQEGLIETIGLLYEEYAQRESAEIREVIATAGGRRFGEYRPRSEKGRLQRKELNSMIHNALQDIKPSKPH